MRKAAAILIGMCVIGAVLIGIAWTYVPAIPLIDPPADVSEDDDRFVDDSLLNPEPISKRGPLDRFDEPSFWETSTGHYEVYRMVLMPTFDHRCW